MRGERGLWRGLGRAAATAGVAWLLAGCFPDRAHEGTSEADTASAAGDTAEDALPTPDASGADTAGVDADSAVADASGVDADSADTTQTVADGGRGYVSVGMTRLEGPRGAVTVGVMAPRGALRARGR